MVFMLEMENQATRIFDVCRVQRMAKNLLFHYMIFLLLVCNAFSSTYEQCLFVSQTI